MKQAKSKRFKSIALILLSAFVLLYIYDRRTTARLDIEETKTIRQLKKKVKGGVYTGSEITDRSERDNGNRMVKHTTYLTITSPYMNDQDVFILANFKHLKYLIITDSCVTYRGVEDLCDLLPINCSVMFNYTKHRDLEESNSLIKENLEFWISTEYDGNRESLKKKLRQKAENANQ